MERILFGEDPLQTNSEVASLIRSSRPQADGNQRIFNVISIRRRFYRSISGPSKPWRQREQKKLRTIRIGIVGGIGKLFVKTTRQAQHTNRSTLEARRHDSSIHPKRLLDHDSSDAVSVTKVLKLHISVFKLERKSVCLLLKVVFGPYL